MFRMTKKMIYALEAVVDIAHNGRLNPVQSREITKRQGIPQRYLEQVLQKLVHDDILRGVRGPKGGYNLARERRRIKVGDVITAINEIDVKDQKDSQLSQSDIGQQVINPLIHDLNKTLMEKLNAMTLQDLCDQIDLNKQNNEANPLDFII